MRVRAAERSLTALMVVYAAGRMIRTLVWRKRAIPFDVAQGRDFDGAGRGADDSAQVGDLHIRLALELGDARMGGVGCAKAVRQRFGPAGVPKGSLG